MRTMSLILVLGLAGPALAQTPAQPEASDNGGFTIRQIEYGVQGVDIDTRSSRFTEYRDVPEGFVLPYIRLAGKDKVRWDFLGRNVLQKDASYRALLEKDSIRLTGELVRIPHRFGNDARSLLTDAGDGSFTMSDTWQQSFQDAIKTKWDQSKPSVNYAFLSGLVNPSLAAAPAFDIGLTRDRGRIELQLTRNKPVDVRVTYFQERRKGNRAAGTSFGFGNVVETAEPIQYWTRDFGVSGEWKQSWGLVRGAFVYNKFTNDILFQTFDNPFRYQDSTDASAYASPGSGSIGGPAVGRASLSPDNATATGSLGAVFKLKKHTRITADVSYGTWTQDSPFMAFSTNTAITSPVVATSLAALPAQSLDGKINVTSVSTGITSRPVNNLTLQGRFRRYDLANETARIQFQGYVRFEAVWEAIPRITVPYGYTSDQTQLSAAYDFGKLSVEGGYKHDKFERTFRETEDTTQNTVYAHATLRPLDWVLVRGTFETGQREFEGLEIELSEEASFQQAGTPANLLAVHPDTVQNNGQPLCPAGKVCNLRFDQANRDTNRFGGTVQLTPGGKATIGLSYLHAKDDYKDSSFGLLSSESNVFSADADYSPGERWSVYAFYSREDVKTAQRGRQSGATVSINALDDWTSDVDDKVDTLGGGANVSIVKDKADLKLTGSYQKVDGNNAIAAPVGGAPEVARRTVGGVAGIPLFDDTKLLTVKAEVAVKATKALKLVLGGLYEDYQLKDSNTTGLVNYVPASFFLAALDSDYQASAVYVRAVYVW